MEAVDPAVLADAIGQLKWWALGFITIWFFLWRFFVYLEARSMRQSKLDEQQSKAQRNAAFTASLNKQSDAIYALATSMSLHDAVTRSSTEEVATTLLRHSAVIEELADLVGDLESKSAGIMTHPNTLSVIEAYYSHITREAQAIIGQSLRENDFASRADHIARKVRTAIGRVVHATRDQLSRINTLSIDPRKFFVVYLNSESDEPGGERFALCDLIWDAIVPVYRSHRTNIDLRIEEANLLIENTIQDHYTSIVSQVVPRTEQQMPHKPYRRTRSEHGG